jgi:hypothetical protein
MFEQLAERAGIAVTDSFADGVKVDVAGLQQPLGDFNTQGLKITYRRIAHRLLKTPMERAFADRQMGRKVGHSISLLERGLHLSLCAHDKRVRVSQLVKQRGIRGLRSVSMNLRHLGVDIQ